MGGFDGATFRTRGRPLRPMKTLWSSGSCRCDERRPSRSGHCCAQKSGEATKTSSARTRNSNKKRVLPAKIRRRSCYFQESRFSFWRFHTWPSQVPIRTRPMRSMPNWRRQCRRFAGRFRRRRASLFRPATGIRSSGRAPTLSSWEQKRPPLGCGPSCGRRSRNPSTGSKPGGCFYRGVQAGTLILQGADALSACDQQQLLEWLEGDARATRILTTTHRPLFPLVESGNFLEALYYRLNVILLVLEPRGPSA